MVTIFMRKLLSTEETFEVNFIQQLCYFCSCYTFRNYVALFKLSLF